MIRVKSKVPLSRKKAVVFVDGECEFWYFQMMRRNENALNLDLLPKLPRKKKLSELYNEVKKSSDDYDLVIWIVDLDKIIEEEKNKKKGVLGPQEEFKRYYRELILFENVEIIISNPCLEYWFLLHFEYTSKPFKDCSEANKQLKQYLKDYDKSQRYFVDNDIYRKIKGQQLKAVENSKRIGLFNLEDFELSVCEMFKLFDPNKKDNILAKYLLF